jgi:hypothetical protein
MGDVGGAERMVFMGVVRSMLGSISTSVSSPHGVGFFPTLALQLNN